MKERMEKERKRKRGIPLEDIVAALIVIVGTSGSTLLLHWLTKLPFWAASLLGGSGFIAVAIGTLFLLCRKR